MAKNKNVIAKLFNGKNKGTEGLNNQSFKFLTNANNETTLYIYDDIGWYGISAQDFATALSGLNGEPLTVRIASNGGSVSDGVAIYNMLRDYPGEVTTINDAIAASIATVIFMAGDVRKAAATASFMTHKPMSSFYGNTDEIVAFAEMLEHFNVVLAKAYEQGGVSAEQSKLLLDDGDYWFMSDAAVEMGFATEQSDAPAMAASVDLSKFDNVPQTVLNASSSTIKIPSAKVTDNKQTDNEVTQVADENTISEQDHATALAEAKAAGFAEAGARRTAVLALDSAKGRETFAENLMANVKLDVEEIDALLQNMPQKADDNGLSAVHLTDDLGDLGNGVSDSDDDTVVDNVATFKANIGKK